MLSESLFAFLKGKFPQPMLFSTFNYDDPLSSRFDQKDLIQFTSDSGIYIIRREEENLFFLSANDKDSNKISLKNIKFISAPSHTQIPYCFIVVEQSENEEGSLTVTDDIEETKAEEIETNIEEEEEAEEEKPPAKNEKAKTDKKAAEKVNKINTVYKIGYISNEIRAYNFYKSPFSILSLHANDKYLFIGTNCNYITRIDNSKKIRRKIIFNVANEKILEMSSFEDLLCIVSSRSRLIVINQNSLATLINIPLTFPILDGLKIKVGKIDNSYSAAILSDSKIHIISFKIKPSSYTYQSSIPAESMISYEIHNDSIVILRENNYHFHDFSGSTSRISVYPRFSNDPQYEWDILEELNFIYNIEIKPSERNKLIKDKQMHFASVFGYSPSSIEGYDFSEFINTASPRQMLTDPDGNLWITSQNSLLYCIPITEEIAYFRGMLNYGNNAICNTKSTPEEISNFISEQNISKYDLEEIFSTFNPKTEDFSTFMQNYRGSIALSLNQYIESRLKFHSIGQKVYELINSYMHSEIDFNIVHNIQQSQKFINQIAEQLYKENKESSEEIAEIFSENFKAIEKYVRNFSSLLNNEFDPIPSWEYSKKFWVSAIIGQSYQIMEYFITLLIASYLYKKLKVDQDPLIRNQYNILNSRIEENIISFASIYNITLYNNVALRFNSLKLDYSNFYHSLFKQLSNLFNSTYFLYKFIDDKSNETQIQIESLVIQDKPNIINLINKAESALKQGSSNENIVKIISNKLKEIDSAIDNLKSAENSETREENLQLIDTNIDEINQFYKPPNPKIPQLELLKTKVHEIQNSKYEINQIYSYSSNMTNPNHLLIVSMIDLDDGHIDSFFRHFRQYKYYDIKVPSKFYEFVIRKTNLKDPQTFIYFFNEEYQNLMFDINSKPPEDRLDKLSSAQNKKDNTKNSNSNQTKSASNNETKLLRPLILSLLFNHRSVRKISIKNKLLYFELYFKNAIMIKDYGSAFNALMGLFSAQKISSLHARSLEYLIASMRKNNAISEFINFSFGIHFQKILQLLSCGSSTSLLIASTLYNKCKEYSKSGGVLLKYANSILAKNDSEISELKKAKSAIILVSSIMKNHEVYIRNSSSMRLINSRDLSKLLSRIEKRILDVSGKMSTISPIESAIILNSLSDITTQTMKSYTEYFTSKQNINQQIFKFIENLKNEEALQLFLVTRFDNNLRINKQINGFWLQIVFAQHNLQGLNALIRCFLVNEREKLLYKSEFNQEKTSEIFNFDFISERKIEKDMKNFYRTCKAIINEIVSVEFNKPIFDKTTNPRIQKIKPIFKSPLSAELTRTFLPLIQIYSLSTLKTNTTHRYISSNYTFSIQANNSCIICCPMGKLQFEITNDSNKIEPFELEYNNNDFIVIVLEKPKSENIFLEIKITGKDDNTEVIFVEST